MMVIRSESQLRLRNRLMSLVAFLFVIYAIADVSVLQAYCGNEALGIPPAHHVSENPNSTASVEQAIYVISADHHQRESDDEHGYDHQHECFCWQQVVVGLYFLDTIRLSAGRESRILVFHDAQHTNSDLSLHLRPPQIA